MYPTFKHRLQPDVRIYVTRIGLILTVLSANLFEYMLYSFLLLPPSLHVSLIIANPSKQNLS